MTGRAQGTPLAVRPATFAHHARAAIEKHVPEARESSAHWSMGANSAWVRFRRPDGHYTYFGLRRHLGWVTGAVGIAREPLDLADLATLPGAPAPGAPGYRISAGDLLGGGDRWWKAGRTHHERLERLDTLAFQMSVKGRAFFRRWPGSPA